MPGGRPGVRVRQGRPGPFGAGLYNPKARVPAPHGLSRHGAGGRGLLPPVARPGRGPAAQRPAPARCHRGLPRGAFPGRRPVRPGGGPVRRRAQRGRAQPGRVQAPWPVAAAPARRLGTKRTVIEVDPKIAAMEGIATPGLPSDPVRTVRIREHGVRYEVDFEQGHKTGFFCDQRENRRRFATWTQDKRVLDLCCYTGGFALAAKVLRRGRRGDGRGPGRKGHCPGPRNANLNQARVEWVHGDAFVYARQMQKNGRLWDVVVLDPPKLILSP